MRWDEPEGRFISALMGAIEVVGKLSASAQAAFVQTSRDGRAAAEADLLRAKEIHEAAQLALTQIRNIELAAKAEHEAVAVQMIDRTLPLFIERLEKVLVIREQRWNKDVARRRYATAGAVVLAIFLAASAWRDGRTMDGWRGSRIAGPSDPGWRAFIIVGSTAMIGAPFAVIRARVESSQKEDDRCE